MTQQEIHTMLTMFITFAVWIFYSAFEGVREAYYYHSVTLSNVGGTRNIHFIYFLQRFLVITLCLFSSGATFSSMVEVFALAYVFPFIHDGFYYCKRNDLNPLIYVKRWKDDSSTSTAKFEIKYKARLWMFVGGLSLFVTTVVLTILKIFK